jgi:hypothetical protein
LWFAGLTTPASLCSWECAETSCLIQGDVDDARYAHFGRRRACGTRSLVSPELGDHAVGGDLAAQSTHHRNAFGPYRGALCYTAVQRRR